MLSTKRRAWTSAGSHHFHNASAEQKKNRSENLLLNILPKEIAEELTAHPDSIVAKQYPNVTVLFTDIVGFTKISGEMSAKEVVTMLNKMFSMFDERAKREGIEKIKTIGDAYMAATGLTQEGNNDGATKMIRFARGLLEDVRTFNEGSNAKLLIRLGINSGPLVAGVIGKTKFIYDIWGDTVNVASRMESTGLPMKIHVTENTKAQTSSLFQYSEHSEIDVTGKGMMKTYFL
ncbi:MAG: adenylate/guanylate cyclase domain-containing protein [Treponema sp.]|nr:adenylate/guanylate cyclase domain-containing protein [Treponema sp.]